MKRTVITLIITALVFSLAISSHGYTVDSYDIITDNFDTVSNSSGLYMLGYSGGTLDVERITPRGTGARLTLGYDISDADIFGSTVVALCNDFDNDQLVVYTYDVDRDCLDSFAIYGAAAYYSKRFFYDRKSLYILDKNRRLMKRYSVNGLLLSERSFNSGVTYIVKGYSDGFCVLSAGSLYKNRGDDYTLICNGISSPAAFAGEDIFSDSGGRFYHVSGNSAEYLFTADSKSLYSSACAVDNTVYQPCGSTVNRYDLSGEKLSYISLDGNITALYADGGSIHAVTGGSDVSMISQDEFIPLNNKTATENETVYSPVRSITSGVYTVNGDTMRITGIPSPTTFAEFKRNMSCEGYTATLYKGNKRMSAGNVGTAMTVDFDSDSEKLVYELAVIGDITGEGSVNSRDVTELMDYLLGTLSFDGAYAEAADISGDGSISLVDLLLLYRMN